MGIEHKVQDPPDYHLTISPIIKSKKAAAERFLYVGKNNPKSEIPLDKKAVDLVHVLL
jgi:hypothetical protein